MKKNNRYSSYENDTMNISSKEQEIITSYDEVVDEYDLEGEEFEIVEEEENNKEKSKKEKEIKKQERKAKKEAKRQEKLEKKQNKKLKKEEKKLSNSIEEFQIEEENDSDVVEEYDMVDEDAVSFSRSEKKKRRKMPIFLGILFLLIVSMVSFDVYRVTKYEKAPIFAIPIRTYKDGGTKEYLGIGYKVIHYQQVQGRRDMVLGTWALHYNTEPINTEVLDLAIEFNNDEVSSYRKYKGQFLRVIGNLTSVSEKLNQITLSYVDEDGKYSLDVICEIADKDDFNELILEYDTTVIGSMSKYRYKTKTDAPIIYLSNCFSEQE